MATARHFHGECGNPLTWTTAASHKLYREAPHFASPHLSPLIVDSRRWGLCGGGQPLPVPSHWKALLLMFFSCFPLPSQSQLWMGAPFWVGLQRERLRVHGCELAKGAPVNNMRGAAAWRDWFPPASYSEKQRTCEVSCCTIPEYFQTSYSFTPSLALFKSKTADQQKASHRISGHSRLCHWPGGPRPSQPAGEEEGRAERVWSPSHWSPHLRTWHRSHLSLTLTVSLRDTLCRHIKAIIYDLSFE